MQVVLHPDAQTELVEAADWHDAKVPDWVTSSSMSSTRRLRSSVSDLPYSIL